MEYICLFFLYKIYKYIYYQNCNNKLSKNKQIITEIQVGGLFSPLLIIDNTAKRPIWHHWDGEFASNEQGAQLHSAKKKHE